MKPPECIPPLMRAGIDPVDARALRRIAMHLHRWFDLECGTEHGAVERDESTGKTYWYNAASGLRYLTRDMETPALARLAKIMSRYPDLRAYVQTDPRGAAIWILRPGDVPEGESADAYYSRGIAVYR